MREAGVCIEVVNRRRGKSARPPTRLPARKRFCHRVFLCCEEADSADYVQLMVRQHTDGNTGAIDCSAGCMAPLQAPALPPSTRLAHTPPALKNI